MARSSPKQVKDAAQINKNWVAAMNAPTTQTKYKDGINRYNGNPMAAAATPEAMQRYTDHVAKSVTSGKRAASLNAADPAMWKQNSLNVGAIGLGTGANKKSAKQLKVAQRWQPIYQAASNAAAAVPNDGGINAGKWQAAVQVMQQAKGKV